MVIQLKKEKFHKITSRVNINASVRSEFNSRMLCVVNIKCNIIVFEMPMFEKMTPSVTTNTIKEIYSASSEVLKMLLTNLLPPNPFSQD